MKDSLKKYLAELIGTAVLVIFGCGTAMVTGYSQWIGYLLTALAFGLALVGMSYAIGNISGCHINPAVSLGVLITGGMSVKDFIGYVISQILGAIAGSGILALIFAAGNLPDRTGAYGSNGLVTDSINQTHAITSLIVELLLTFVFVLIVLGVTSKKENNKPFGGLVIGLSLTMAYLLGIFFTGTSVNPARSIGPAIWALIAGHNTTPLSCVWVFIVAPLAGAALAAFAYKFLTTKTKKTAD